MWRREIELKEMLSDPIVLAVMRADGVDRGELDALLASIARTRADGGERSPLPDDTQQAGLQPSS